VGDRCKIYPWVASREAWQKKNALRQVPTRSPYHHIRSRYIAHCLLYIYIEREREREGGESERARNCVRKGARECVRERASLLSLQVLEGS